MRSWTNMPVITLVCTLSFVALVCSVRAMHARTDSRAPGMLPYSPTRLEWLELELQANYREEDDTDPDTYHTLDFTTTAPDTVVVLVQYSNRTSAIIVDRMVEHGKRLAKKEVASYGWSSWVKIEVRRELIEAPKQ